MARDELEEFLRVNFPGTSGTTHRVEKVDDMFSQVRLPYEPEHLRPGGTILGPALMTLADTAMYVAVLAMIGPVPLALTTNLNINFLKRPRPSDLVARCWLLKLGARLAFGEVKIYSEGDGDPVAHATVTYSIPPVRAQA
jgi:uncharacterized protein (TIGR00369 family)